MNTKILAAAAAAGALAAGALAGGTSSATAARAAAPRTIELALESTHAIRTPVDAPPLQSRSHPGDSPGDEMIVTGPLTDAAHRVTGAFYGEVTTMTATDANGASTEQLTATLTLRGGTLSIQGVSGALSRTSHAAIVGGTGRYAGADGEVVSTFTPTAVDISLHLLSR